jgi:hypothetical protein
VNRKPILDSEREKVNGALMKKTNAKLTHLVVTLAYAAGWVSFAFFWSKRTAFAADKGVSSDFVERQRLSVS